jgi:hypothetical protein
MVVITAAGITMVVDMEVQRMAVITAAVITAAVITIMVDMEVHPAPLSVK